MEECQVDDSAGLRGDLPALPVYRHGLWATSLVEMHWPQELVVRPSRLHFDYVDFSARGNGSFLLLPLLSQLSPSTGSDELRYTADAACLLAFVFDSAFLGIILSVY